MQTQSTTWIGSTIIRPWIDLLPSSPLWALDQLWANAILFSHRKVDVRRPGKWNSNSHGARSVHLIITMIKWIRTSRLSKKNSVLFSPTFAANFASRARPMALIVDQDIGNECGWE